MPMFYKLEILKIEDIFTLQIAKFIYKSLSGDTPENFHEWFKLNSDSHTYNTRSNYIPYSFQISPALKGAN